MSVITPAMLHQFDQDGYLVVENLLDPERDIQPVNDEYSALLDELTARWFAEGRIPATFAGLPLVDRLTRLLQSGQSYVRYLSIALPQTKVTEDTPIHLGPAVFNMLRNPRLLDAAEAFLGGEIYCHPVHNIRLKPPEALVPEDFKDNGTISRTPWHQDQGVILPEADQSRIVTVWLPITDATEENGCLMVVPRSHRDGLVDHCLSSEKGLHIPPHLISAERIKPVPVKRGGALFMDCRTLHASLVNVSDGVRWSFDLRYSVPGQPTGRPAFPGFVARSRQNPTSELRDAGIWADLWRQTRSRLAAADETPVFNRWKVDGAVCA